MNNLKQHFYFTLFIGSWLSIPLMALVYLVSTHRQVLLGIGKAIGAQ